MQTQHPGIHEILTECEHEGSFAYLQKQVLHESVIVAVVAFQQRLSSEGRHWSRLCLLRGITRPLPIAAATC